MAIANVLVVDDQPVIVECVSQFLRAAGYEPLGAAGPKQALEILAAQERIDLVISDMVMPEMQGPELVEEIRRRSPSTATMLMSGYASTINSSGGMAFLEKPFKRAELLAKVAEVLGRAQETHDADAQIRKPMQSIPADHTKQKTG